MMKKSTITHKISKSLESTAYKLSVIIPFRCETESTQHLLLRLEDLCSELVNAPSTKNQIEFIVVDSGSVLPYRSKCKEICEKYGVTYLYHDTAGKSFSIGACRDFGVQYAKGKAISFLDVDLRVAPDFWSRLLVLMSSWGISKYKKSFLAIPCLYLTQDGTTEFLNSDPSTKFTDFYLRYLQGDKQAIENMAFCSSMMVVERNHYLAIGGHDIAFRGHGYEDFELYHRLLCEEDIIPKSRDYFVDQKTWNTATYKGFRSHLAIVGRPAMMSNLFVVHLWHSRPKDASFYTPKSLTANRTIWEEKFKTFVNTGLHSKPLPTIIKEKDNVLFFGSTQAPSYLSIREAVPHLGNIIHVNEHDFMDRNGELKEYDFSSLIQNYSITRIIFPNPYGNLSRLSIYNWCCENNIPFYCFDRGALPDSWFFDPNGFNSDSISYNSEMWDIPLNDNETQTTQEYINYCLNTATALEKQDSRIGAEVLAQNLKIGGKKVLFVPMQRPSDTVIKYMSGNIQSFTKFMNVIDILAENLKSKGWVVLCKKHPLETESPQLRHAQYVPENTHFLDLLELADSIALINSGVGVYAMMMEKPCYIFGNAFYAHNGLNEPIKNLDFETDKDIEFVAQKIVQNFTVNREKMYRFIYYLTNKFYSFGIPKTTSRTEKDGSLRTITTGIDFYQLRLDGKLIFEYEPQPRPKLALSAPIFERYALDIHMQKKSVSSTVATTPDKKTPPKPTTTAPKSEPSVNKAPPRIKVNEQVKVNSQPTEMQQNLIKDISSHKKTRKDIRLAKLRKLMNNPYRFFADSKNPLAKKMANLLKNK